MCVAEEYRVPNPVAKHHGDWKMLSGMFVFLPYLTNEKELQPGDLLVLPFDGGMPAIRCEVFPPIKVPTN